MESFIKPAKTFIILRFGSIWNKSLLMTQNYCFSRFISCNKLPIGIQRCVIHTWAGHFYIINMHTAIKGHKPIFINITKSNCLPIISNTCLNVRETKTDKTTKLKLRTNFNKYTIQNIRICATQCWYEKSYHNQTVSQAGKERWDLVLKAHIDLYSQPS